MKYRFVWNWDNGVGLKKDLLRSFRIPEGMELVLDSSYDVLIVVNGHPDLQSIGGCTPSKTYGFTMEPSWSGGLNMDSVCFNTIYTHIEGRWNNAKIVPSMLFYLLPEDASFFTGSNFKKSKKLSFIVSNIRGHHLYNFRTSLVEALLRTNLDFDLFGKGWSLSDRRYKGPIQSKTTGLLDYEYSVCIENCSESNYVTEKLTDCFMTDTVPIYYGCPNIQDIYDPATYHMLDPQNPVDHIKSIIEGTTRKDTRPSKQRFFEKYDLLKFVWENCK